MLLAIASWAAALFCAWHLARAAGARSRLVAAVVALALLAVFPGELGRLCDSLRGGMAIAAVLFLAAGAALARWAAGPAAAPAPPGAVVPFARRLAWPRWPGLVAGALGLACVVDGAITRNFFDEEHHVPMAQVIARGVIPPMHPLVPGQVIPYHWGIDALYAQLVVAGLRPDHAIDVVTMASWILFVAAAALAGAVLTAAPASDGAARARRAAWFAVIVPLAGSALAAPLHDGMGLLQIHTNPYPATWVEWTRRPPPITADFFQHPQGLAFPIVLVILALWFCDDGAGPRRRLLAAFLLSLLSLVQAIHFLVLGFALFASSLHELWKARAARDGASDFGTSATMDMTCPSPWWWSFGVLAAALACAFGYGGFFSLGSPTGSSLVWGVDFFADRSLGEKLVHHAVVFGLPFVLLPIAALRRGPNAALRVALVAGAAMGWFLPNVVVYAGSWDIVKLCSAGGFLAAIAFADTVDAWTASSLGAAAARPARPTRFAKLGAAVAAAAFTIWFPLTWMASRTVLQGHAGVPRKNDWRLRDDALAVGRAVDDEVPGRARVLLGDAELARMNGLLAPGFDPKRYASGHMLDFDKARRLQAARTVALRTLDAGALRELDVDYALLSRADAARLSGRLAAFHRVDDVALPDGYVLYRLR